MTRERYTCQQVIDALQQTRGMVYLAAEVLGCIPQTVYNYIERHPSIKAAWEAESGLMTDLAEQKLYNAIMRDESWAIGFYLKTKGKSRGYTERLEVGGTDGGPIKLSWADGSDFTRFAPDPEDRLE